MMNHDYTHCADYDANICPATCFRAEVTAELEANKENIIGVPISWAHFRRSKECELDKKPKWLYRLESRSPDNGLWYNAKGVPAWGIGQLPNCKTKDIPMEYDERYRKDGRAWFSSCSDKKDLSHWYSLQDALDLIENGFVFTKYLATEYVEYDNETTFIKESCLAREEIDISDIWGKRMTNADKIRAMTDEELAKLFNKIDLGNPPFCDGIDMCDQGYAALVQQQNHLQIG